MLIIVLASANECSCLGVGGVFPGAGVRGGVPHRDGPQVRHRGGDAVRAGAGAAVRHRDGGAVQHRHRAAVQPQDREEV